MMLPATANWGREREGERDKGSELREAWPIDQLSWLSEQRQTGRAMFRAGIGLVGTERGRGGYLSNGKEREGEGD